MRFLIYSDERDIRNALTHRLSLQDFVLDTELVTDQDDAWEWLCRDQFDVFVAVVSTEAGRTDFIEKMRWFRALESVNQSYVVCVTRTNATHNALLRTVPTKMTRTK